MKVILAVDESETAAAAAREVEDRLTASGTSVRVLHVVGTFVPPAAALLDADGSLEGVRHEVTSRYYDLVNGIAGRLKDRGIEAEGIVRDGDAGRVIVSEAEKWNADLIVLGAHGLTGLEGILMGNVARYVVDRAPCSVEVVRPK